MSRFSSEVVRGSARLSDGLGVLRTDSLSGSDCVGGTPAGAVVPEHTSGRALDAQAASAAAISSPSAYRRAGSFSIAFRQIASSPAFNPGRCSEGGGGVTLMIW